MHRKSANVLTDIRSYLFLLSSVILLLTESFQEIFMVVLSVYKPQIVETGLTSSYVHHSILSLRLIEFKVYDYLFNFSQNQKNQQRLIKYFKYPEKMNKQILAAKRTGVLLSSTLKVWPYVLFYESEMQ